MKYGKLYNQLPLEKRKKVRAQVASIMNSSLEQKKLIYDLYIKPIDERIELLVAYQKNQISDNRFFTSMEHVNKRIQQVFNTVLRN